MYISVQGLQDAQQDNLKMIRALRPSTGLGQAVRGAISDLHRYAVMITHVDTGTLRASHRIAFGESYGGAEASISIDENAVNPRTGQHAVEYGPVEHARWGGGHAFYGRTYEERGDRAVDVGMSALIRSLD